MNVFRSIVFSAVLSGLIVGIVVTALQQFGTVPLILQAEIYEKATDKAAPVAHSDAAAVPHEHEHGDEGWEPADGFERNAFTAAFNVIDWIGFGLLLNGAFVLFRRSATWREGFLWGLGGFAAIMLAPGLGLPPELPGIPAAPLGPRQIWWIGTALATAAGLGLIAFRRTPALAVVAVALIVAPHLIGAPQLADLHTEVPEALSHRFVVTVLVTSFVSWALLGALTGAFYRMFSRQEERAGTAAFA
ncbi:cobalt transporter subunit CbtA [Faunimonas pinastri]|uniref:Cobalt transporter subunit CbtA n=1 Tax=Faunimonas pinastri TaxID=1855383 RepID=A0A1H9DFQ5_9HYPH|nr:CbtA family protein [Faunimonas pinastri]SEQ12137.1 cobalt transporter subunit CbtA [Faunimonas pinastri]